MTVFPQTPLDDDHRDITDPIAPERIGPLVIRATPDPLAAYERPAKVTVTVEYASGARHQIEVTGPVDAGVGFETTNQLDEIFGRPDSFFLPGHAPKTHMDLRFRNITHCRWSTTPPAERT
jgi:hypothetical protein